MRAGDFSSIPVPLLDPQTGLPFENNQIPADRISPQALALLTYFPDPNLPGVTRNFHQSSSYGSTGNNFNLRIQHNFSGQANTGGGRGGGGGGGNNNQRAPQSNAGLAGRGRRLLGTRTNVNMNLQVQYQNNDSDSLNVFSGLGGLTEGKSYGISDSFNIQRGRTQHQISASYNHTNSATRNHFGGVLDVSNELLGIQGVSQDPFSWGLPRVQFSSMTGLSDLNPSLQDADRISTQYSWNHPFGRKHQVRAGGDFRFDRTTTNSEGNANGNFVYNGLYTTNGGRDGAGIVGFDFADFLLGMPASASIAYGPGESTLTGRSMSMFVQDDWRARPNLTMQLGVRYDLLWPFVEEHGHLVNLDVNSDFTGAAPVESGGTGEFTGTFPNGAGRDRHQQRVTEARRRLAGSARVHRPRQLRGQLQQRHLLVDRPTAGAAAAVCHDRHQHRFHQLGAVDGERAHRHPDRRDDEQLRHRQGLRARAGRAVGRQRATQPRPLVPDAGQLHLHEGLEPRHRARAQP